MTPLDHYRDIDDAIEAGATLDELYANTSPIEPPARPLIRVGPDLDRVADECVAALAHAKNMYQRDGLLVHLVHVNEPNGRVSLRVKAMEVHTVRERLASVGDFEILDSKKQQWVQRAPSKDIASLVLARGEWPGVPALAGVTETPSIRSDGSIIDKPGYDARTGFVFEPARAYPRVPAHPTREDAAAAYRELEEPWGDFQTSAAGKAVPVVQVLSQVGKPAIDGPTPGLLYDASVHGAGKSLEGRCAFVVANGGEPALTTWPNNHEELEKILSSLALSGVRYLMFDNVSGEYGGDALEKCLTCVDRVALRVLGKSERREFKWNAQIVANGNNVSVTPDTARRTLVQRLEPKEENPGARDQSQFKIKNLPRWCHDAHPRLIVAALTILRAYILAGKPLQNLPGWGGFEEWVGLVANAIKWAGGPNVLECRAIEAMDPDEGTAAMRIFLCEWPKLFPYGATAKSAIATLYPSYYWQDDAAKTDSWADLRTAIETLTKSKQGYTPDPRTLGNALRKRKARWLDDRQVRPDGDGKTAAKWVVICRGEK